jgi:predicted enzyme related to lactoylglutathione lyase
MTKLVLAGLALSAFVGYQSPPPEPALAYRPTLLIQLAVSDLDRAVMFYTTVLRFTLTERRDDLKFAHINTNVPGLEIGLNAVADPKGTGSAVLNIGVADVVAGRRALEQRGVVFRGETVIIPGKVALAQFADPDGNTLRLAGPPPRK